MESTDLISFASRFDQGLSETLVLRGQGGDRAAIGELFERYRDRILRIVRARMGPALANAIDAEDVLQETYLRALSCFEQLELKRDGSIIAWFGAISMNVVRENVKKRSGSGTPRQPLPLPGGHAGEEENAEVAVAGNELRPSEILRARELQKKIDDAVNSLTAEYREIVVLRFYEECDWRHITTKLGLVSEGAAQMKLTRANVKLGSVLGRYMGG